MSMLYGYIVVYIVFIVPMILGCENLIYMVEVVASVPKGKTQACGIAGMG